MGILFFIDFIIVGIGVQSSLDEAVRWYTKAASQDNQRAKQRLAEIKKYNKMQRRIKADRNNGGDNSDCVLM
jgi:TPR repeat protein